MTQLSIADLNTIQVALHRDPSRWQGVRYTLTKPHASAKTLIFHDIYSQILPLAATDEKEDLQALRAFIIKLEGLEGEGRAYYQEQSQKSCLYKWLTKLHRLVSKIMGKAPKAGTHAERLDGLKRRVDQKIRNIEIGYHEELYTTLKAIIENSSKSEAFYISKKLLPECSRIERKYVLDKFMDDHSIYGFADYCDYDGYEKYKFIDDIIILPTGEASQKWFDENPELDMHRL